MIPPNLEYSLRELFAGRANPLQKKAVEEWLRQPGNEELYYQLLAKWEADHAQYVPDTNASLRAYERFMAGQQAYPRQAPVRPLTVHRPFLGGWRAWSVAASVVVLAGSLWASRSLWLYERYTAPFGVHQTVSLADGTTVTLNANSELRTPRFDVGTGDREVWLQGEGYFAVTRKPDKRRFVVHTPNLDVEVLGTKFNVLARRGNTEVVLNEGKVELISHETAKPRRVLMKPGDQVTLAQGDTAFRKATIQPAKAPAWQQSRLVFNETPLSRVAQTIEDYYGVRVVIGNRDLARRELTGTLPNNDLDVVLRSLSLSYNVAVVREKNRIVLR